MARRPGPKLTPAQRTQLLTWLAAGYSGPIIAAFFAERTWPAITDAALTYYRNKYRPQIQALAAARHSAALNTGLALKEERIARLKEDAEWLESIKTEPGKSGKLYNEAAWRETLVQIAEELGQHVTKQDITSGGQAITTFLALVQAAQEPPT
jgi:hypothetical protein